MKFFFLFTSAAYPTTYCHIYRQLSHTSLRLTSIAFILRLTSADSMGNDASNIISDDVYVCLAETSGTTTCEQSQAKLSTGMLSGRQTRLSDTSFNLLKGRYEALSLSRQSRS